MKIRIGIGAGIGSSVLAGPGPLAQFVDDLDQLGFDSVWLPEILTMTALGPLTGLAFCAGHNPHLKLGTTMLLPGSNPVRLAKELATLDVLSGGRLLVTFVPGLPHRPESGALGVDVTDRGAAMDELLPVLRELWDGRTVTHHGRVADVVGASISPLPTQRPLEMWTGGLSGARARRRCGRLADGWLPSACTPDEAARGRSVIEGEAAAAGRTISPEHFGVSLAYSERPLTPEEGRRVAPRRGVDVRSIVPVGLDGLRRMLEEFCAVGFSKFVVRPLGEPASWRATLEALERSIGDLQT